MKSTWFGCRKRYDFARLLHESDYSQQHHEKFRCFLEAAAGSFQQAVHQFAHGGEQCPEIEERVVKAQQRLKHPEKLSEALGVLVLALEDRRYDFLGSVMSELEINDTHYRGQCFTPPEICRLMCEMTFGEVSADNGHRLKISEPCCGGGAMVIAASEHLIRHGFWPWNYWIQAVDVDWKCWAMSYIQLTLLSIPAEVIWGNTITLETFGGAVTLAGALHPLRDDPVVVAELPADRTGGQLTLFAMEA